MLGVGRVEEVCMGVGGLSLPVDTTDQAVYTLGDCRVLPSNFRLVT